MKDKKKKGGRGADSGREDWRELEMQCGVQEESNKKKQKELQETENLETKTCKILKFLSNYALTP